MFWYVQTSGKSFERFDVVNFPIDWSIIFNARTVIFISSRFFRISKGYASTSFWNLCRFLWMHLRKDLPFDYICIQAIINVQYMAVSQQIRLCIEELPLGSQQGLMDRAQSPIKHSESNSLIPHLLLQPLYTLLLFLTHLSEVEHLEGIFPHTSLIGKWCFLVICCFYLILHVILCNKHVIWVYHYCI